MSKIFLATLCPCIACSYKKIVCSMCKACDLQSRALFHHHPLRWLGAAPLSWTVGSYSCPSLALVRPCLSMGWVLPVCVCVCVCVKPEGDDPRWITAKH